MPQRQKLYKTINYNRDYIYMIAEEEFDYETAIQEEEWKYAMQKKIDALHNNETCTLTKSPKHRKAIGNKWAFKKSYMEFLRHA
ncbi:hypothetical protein JTB14_002858 [Gonioctena quinquepunctata]|nr:hypothetical protein JTB14_002858 [Gonioctena quinquepunctata]